MTMSQQLASFVCKATFEHLSDPVKNQLKIRVLDSIGCALGALDYELLVLLKRHIEDFRNGGPCTLIGGGRTSPDFAAFFNGALVRYLDFNDTYLAPGESCHPSDNIGAVLSACEYSKGTGRDLLTALSVAYQVQCRLCDEAPVRGQGFDHTTQGTYAVASGVSKALHLDEERTANAIAISGTAFNALRVTRTGSLSHWKGLAYPNTAFACVHSTFLAMRGITGPIEVFEGSKGFMESIAGPFHVDWLRENLDKVMSTIIKKYNAEAHSQSAIEAILDLKRKTKFAVTDVIAVEIETFQVAYDIIGGGNDGPKIEVATKEDADHSFPYIAAVAILDGDVMPEQYGADRICRPDVQDLLKKVTIKASYSYSARFPQEMPCLLRIHLKDGSQLVTEKSDYEGFHTKPVTWDAAVRKFEILGIPVVDSRLCKDIVQAVADLENIRITELTELLGAVRCI